MAKIVGKVEERKIDPDNITKEDVLAMAEYIKTLEQMLKDIRGYTIQLETMLQQRNSQLKQQRPASQGITTFKTVETNLDL